MFDALRRILNPGPGAPTSAKSESASPESAVPDDLVWQDESVDGRRILWRPARRPAESPGAVLFLHGHGRQLLDRSVAYQRELDRHNLAVVCPDGGQSWWLDLPSPEFPAGVTPQAWLRGSVVPWIECTLNVKPPRIALLGVSMGGQGALQLAYRQAAQFPVVAAVAPAVDFFQLHGAGTLLDQMFVDAEAARQATVVLNLHPLAWPRYQWFCCDPADIEWFDGAARLGMKLSSSGILHERDLETTGGGHSWGYFDRMAAPAIEHIATSLRKADAAG
jgi:S-formylglutathione hydrolase